ncbi:MAG: hypothetical protein KJ060_09330, partial [Candidatus Hydrogenedentes bacterium]|nr:hypothetical protein [Candidatus Hydrogenedentota bacterium]
MTAPDQQNIAVDQENDSGSGGGLYAIIRWMTLNHVASNIIMMVLLLGGLATAFTIKQEVYPSFQLDIVDISVSYPGSPPEEVEDGLILPI